MSSSFLSQLRDAAQALSLSLDARQEQAMLDYLVQLQRWNRTYNLTAIRDPQQMLVQHIFDSLSVVGPLAREFSNRTEGVHLLDIGSGAGLPGVIIAIMQPQWQVSCIDAVEKKCAFVQQIAGVLKLANLRSRHGRVEMLQNLGATAAISRAFASLKDFASLADAHIPEGGLLIAMKGKPPEEEIVVLQNETAWRVGKVETLQVPALDAQRCLVWMTRDKESHEPR